MKAKLLTMRVIFCIVFVLAAFVLTAFVLAAFPAGAQETPVGGTPIGTNEAAQLPVSDALPSEPKDLDQAPDAITQSTPIITEAESADTSMNIVKRLGIVLVIIAVQALLIWLLWWLFARYSLQIAKTAAAKIKPLKVKNITLLSTKQIMDITLVSLKMFKYLITFIQLYLTLPIIFSLFPATESLASTLFGYILNPLRDFVIAAIEYVPNLITIVIIVIIVRYVVKVLRFFTVKIAAGKLELSGFHPDLVEPTFNILRVLLWAFAFVLIYPYLPGSQSEIFQGVSVFVGIIISLGSTTAIGNLVAGVVLTYMRSFIVGDRIRIKETTGFVVEKTMMAVRLRTHKNEYVTFPNLTILSSEVINYHNAINENADGLILYTEVTSSYSTPWQTIHDILIRAALATEHVQQTPSPFVLQTGMDDFYARYQINCYTKEIEKIPRIYAKLYENIQNGFHEAGIDMTSAHYRIIAAQDHDAK